MYTQEYRVIRVIDEVFATPPKEASSEGQEDTKLCRYMQGLCDDESIGGSQVLSMGQVMMIRFDMVIV